MMRLHGVHLLASWMAKAAIVAAFAIYAGCESKNESVANAGAPPGDTAMVDDSPLSVDTAGAEIIDPASLTQIRRFELKPSVTLGAEGNSIPPFGFVAAAAMDSHANTYVLDPMAGNIRVFARTGAPLRQFGRKGGGPGEFYAPSGITVANDTVFVIDRRLLAFDTLGTVLFTKNLPDSYETLFHTAAGVLVQRTSTHVPRTAEYGTITKSVMRFDIATGVSDTLLQLSDTAFRFGKHTEWYRLFTQPGTVYAVGADGRIYHSSGRGFRISVESPIGEPERTVASLVPRVRVSKGDQRDLKTSMVARFQRVNLPAPDYDGSYGSGPRATHRPAIGALAVSNQGQLLVKRPDVSARPYATEDPSATSEWLLLSSEMKPSIRLVLPTSVSILDFSGCTIVAHRFGEDEESLIDFYTLPPESSCTSAGARVDRVARGAGG